MTDKGHPRMMMAMMAPPASRVDGPPLGYIFAESVPSSRAAPSLLSRTDHNKSTTSLLACSSHLLYNSFPSKLQKKQTKVYHFYPNDYHYSTTTTKYHYDILHASPSLDSHRLLLFVATINDRTDAEHEELRLIPRLARLGSYSSTVLQSAPQLQTRYHHLTRF